MCRSNHNPEGPGAVYVFTGSGSTWTEKATLTAANGHSADFFGAETSMSVDGKTIAVGLPAAPFDFTNNQMGPGTVYIFTK